MDIDQKSLDAFNAAIANQTNQVSGVLGDSERRNRENMEFAAEAGRHRRAAEEAQIKTAEDTAEIKGHLEKVIENQNDLIAYQKQQLSTQQQQLEMQEEQLKTLQSQLDKLRQILLTGEDNTAIQSEVLEILSKKLPSDHPIRSFLADKGGDVLVQGLFTALNIYMKSKGIMM